MPTPDQILLVRQTLIAGGLRTFAYDFNGSGDDGSIDELFLPEDPSQPLEPYITNGDGLDDFERPVDSKWDNTTYKHTVTPKPQYAAILKLLDTTEHAEKVLENLAYAALEHFDGDWVNNEGGYGRVAVDLVTGEFYIDGQQNVSDTIPAVSDGTLDQMDPLPQALDITSLVKQTLK